MLGIIRDISLAGSEGYSGLRKSSEGTCEGNWSSTLGHIWG